MKLQIQNRVDHTLSGRSPDLADGIFVRLDAAGFFVDASANVSRLGIDLDALLVMPHVTDFVAADHQPKVARYFQQVVSAEGGEHGVRFPANTGQSNETCDVVDAPAVNIAQCEDLDWYDLTLTRLDNDAGKLAGVIGTLQIVRQPITAASAASLPKSNDASNDPFTDLADRRSFVRELTGSIAMNQNASVAILAIDGMRAIFMQYGQATADEIRWGFARFLEAMAEPHFTLAQIDDERFGVILPGRHSGEAKDWACETLRTFAGLAMADDGRKPDLSASAGVARVELSAEWTMRQAELGLVMARAAGGMQAAICRPQSTFSCGRSVERAIETIVERTAKRAS
ncbi:MAG: GGDEF domain-containing protein [Erythrobacter sp.]|uniref:GGDEF domain-containing protein n=1 Tax=Erythrobacter sp. TaxID=1042 RepID=UPI003297C383